MKKQDRFSEILHLQAQDTMNLMKRKAARFSWFNQIEEEIKKQFKADKKEEKEKEQLEEGQIQPRISFRMEKAMIIDF